MFHESKTILTMTTIETTNFDELCTSPSGILLENASLLIGVREEYDGARGCIAMYIGNESKSPLSNVRVILDPVDDLEIRIQEATDGLLEHQKGCTIAVATQAKLVVTVKVYGPFDYAPGMRVMFRSVDGINHEHYVRLPVVVTSFMTPVGLSLQNFKYQWDALERNECQTILKHVPADHACMTRISGIVQRLNLEQCKECDDTPWSVSGASVFHTASKDARGNPISFGCFVRIEADHRRHRALRVITRTQSLLCSKALQNVLLSNIQGAI
jgi:AP-2 complex subunit alpha